MRIQHRYLTFDSHTKIIKPVKAILDKYSINYEYKDAPFFSELKQALNKFDIDPQIGTVYEKTDIEKAEWFIVNPGQYQYPQPEGDFGYLEATFNLDNHCGLCGIGKVQNAPYRIKTEPIQRKSQFWGLHWTYEAIFVRQETQNILRSNNVKGIQFSKPVLHKKGIEIESYHQLHIDTILEKGFDHYNAQIITCKINNEENLNTDKKSNCCGRIKFHHPRIGGYLFDKNIFKADFDIVQTNEYFGSGGSANRLQIVSKRIKKLIEENKLKGLSFTPIVHERL